MGGCLTAFYGVGGILTLGSLQVEAATDLMLYVRRMSGEWALHMG